ncbi:MAG: pyridoxal-phosphate-dependent aminotransferase family protein [Anaerolineales bacterium]
MATKLMIPGPVRVDDDVLFEMGQQVRPHYGADWTTDYNETRELLKQVFKTEGDVHILSGSGSAAIDAAIGSLATSGETVVVGNNGFFGDRLEEICQGYGLQVDRVCAPLGEPLDPDSFRHAFSADPRPALVALVYLETATAVVNPVREIAAVAGEYGVPVMVDAVSALGGVPLSMDEWGIDICASASQKCLGAPPGLGPVAVSPRAWKIMESKPDRGHGWYLNLETWSRFADEWGRWHPHPVTVATSNIYALRAGLQKLLDEGIDRRIARYTELALRLRNGVRTLGMEPLTPDDRLAPVLTAIYAPEGVKIGELLRYLREEHNVMISGGLGEGLEDRVLRVGHMSPTVSEDDIDDVLRGLQAFLEFKGIPLAAAT